MQGPSPTAGPGAFAACGVPEGQTSSPQFRTEAGNACADLSGNAVSKTPEHALNFGALYRAALDRRGNSWFVELDGQYRSKRYVDEANLSWMPSYTNLDLRAGLEFDRFSVIGFIDNLTDEDTIRSAQRNVDPGDPEGFRPGSGSDRLPAGAARGRGAGHLPVGQIANREPIVGCARGGAAADIPHAPRGSGGAGRIRLRR